MCKTKISPSRRSMHGVMGNPKWGALKIKQGGLEVHIPQSRITKKEGVIYKHTQRLLDKAYSEGFTKEIVDELDRSGVDVYIESVGVTHA